MAINWDLGRGNNALAHFETGYRLADHAMQAREQREQRNAMLEIQRQQEARLQQQQEAQALRQQRDDRRADLPLMEKLLTGLNPDNFAQRRQLAQQYDIPGLPEQFDPVWAQQTLESVRLLNTPQGQEAASALGKELTDNGYRLGTPEFQAEFTRRWNILQTKHFPTVPGGGLAAVVPGQAAQFVIAPNDGSQTPGAPVAAGGIPPEAIADLRQNPGTAAQFDEVFGPGAAARVLGNGGAGASRIGGNFLDGL